MNSLHPSELGFRMPPEWADRERTLMAWPVREEIWPDGITKARKAFARVARAIAAYEPVSMIVKPSYAQEAAELCGDSVVLMELNHDDSWIRDSGPTIVCNETERLGISWRFNAWGRKYRPFDADDALAALVLESLDIKVYESDMVLEGGSIHVDGEGTLIATEECLLNVNRNPELRREEIEIRLMNSLGVSRVIWLPKGLYGDETDGHVDNVCCFIRPGEVMLQICDDPQDPDYAISRENLEILRESTDALGRRLIVHTVKAPPRMEYRGNILAASYVNFYPVKGAIILPLFGKEAASADKNAIDVFRKLFPHCIIEGVDGLSILKGGGNVHCITQQVPVAGTRKPESGK